MGTESSRRSAPSEPQELIFDPRREGIRPTFDRYAELYSPGGDVARVGDAFFASVGARLTPGMAIFDRKLIGVEHRRDRRRILRDGMDHFTVQLVRSGSLWLDADGTRLSLGPGEGAVVDMTRPFCSSAAARLHTLSIPRRRLLELGADPAGLHGMTLRPDDGRLERLLLSDRTPASELILQALQRRLGAATGGTVANHRQERARAYIETNLADPDLSPSHIAAACGLSRASLYRVFEPLGGVTEWVQTRRLQRVRVLLATTPMTIADVGLHAGFVNASHLTFAFRARFSCSPSQYRRSREPALPRGEAASAARALADMSVILAMDEGREAA